MNQISIKRKQEIELRINIIVREKHRAVNKRQFQTYLNEFRLSKIYADIVQTDTPIYQILEKHGFTNYKVFRRMFAERFHDTPSHIRRNMQ